jgi:hypothetical protein
MIALIFLTLTGSRPLTKNTENHAQNRQNKDVKDHFPNSMKHSLNMIQLKIRKHIQTKAWQTGTKSQLIRVLRLRKGAK